MPTKFIEQLGLSTATSALGAMNTGIDYLFKQNEREQEKQWWYEQQKYLEEHNSPAYRSMQMRKAGLNPYTEVSSSPLGNVDSSLPRMGSSNTFDINAIQNSLLLTAQRDNIEQDTQTKGAQAGMYESESALTQEKVKTESEWRSNIIQQTLNLQQDYELGLIDKATAEAKFQELKDAYEQGYNHYIQEMNKNQAEIDLIKAEEESVESATRRANELHEDNKKFLKNQISLQNYEMAIQSFYADKIDADYYARKLLGVDVEKVNPVFLPTIYQFVEAERRGLLTDEQFDAFVDNILTLLESDQNSYLHNVDPDYIDKLERAGLYLDFQEYKIRKDEFRLADAVAAINADIGYRSLKLNSINTAGNILDTLTGIYKKGMPSVVKRIK